jgi:hypothetical protein
MISKAQKIARENFKKAIDYRKKTGCTLKQAFAHVKRKKVAGYVKTIKKGTKTDVIYTRSIAKKKSAKPVQKKLFGVKNKADSKKKTINHKDLKSNNVNIKVLSGIQEKSLLNLKYLINELSIAKNNFETLKIHKKHLGKNFTGNTTLLKYPKYISSLKKQITEAKKNIN